MKIIRKGSWYQGVLFRSFMIGLSFCLIFAISYRLNQVYLQRAGSLIQVVVTRQAVLPGSLLKSTDLVLAERPVFGLGDDYLLDITNFLQSGHWYAGNLGFGKGDVLRPSRLVEEEKNGGSMFQRLSQDGKWLIAVETDLVRSCASWIVPGTRVDGMVFLKGKEGFEVTPDQVIGPKEDPYLQNLLVVDKKNSSGRILDNESETGLGKDNLPAVITLMLNQVDEDQAKALIRYNELGKIYFLPKAFKDLPLGVN